MKEERETAFKKEIAAWLGTGPERIHLYWKGRVALYALLKAAGIKEGDEVIIPGFTCVVVPNAVIYTGARPVYVDIDRTTLNPTSREVMAAVTARTRAIVVQNTFGLSSGLEEITSLAREKGILTIEDCTHGFGGTCHGRPNGTFCDASFFSTQWNKPFSTGIGGFSAVFSDTLAESIEKTDEQLIQPTLREEAVLKILITSRKLLLTPATYYLLRGVYRVLSRFNLTIGSSSGDELEEPVMPAGYFKSMGRIQAAEGLRELSRLDKVIERRIKNAERYTGVLAQHGKYHVAPVLHTDHSFLKYPVLVREKKRFEAAARAEGIDLGDWFVSPIHPVEKDFRKWQLDPDRVPVAASLMGRMFNLPTDTKHPGRVIAFIEKYLDQLV